MTSRSPRKPSTHRQRALERRVARLERIIAQPKPEPVLPVYPLLSYSGRPNTGTMALPEVWQIRSDTGTTTFVGCLDLTTTTINAQQWATNEGSGGYLH